MPGFFMTFMLLAAAAAWCRYVASTRGPTWLVWVPAPGLLIWLLGFVFAAASMSADSGVAGDPATRVAIDAMSERLTRVRVAAGAGQWAGIGTVVLTLALTAWSYLRPAAPAE